MHRLYLARAVVTGIGLALVGAVLTTGVVRCPSALLLGIPCPACGTTRAARAILAGDVARAFSVHPVAPMMLAVIALLSARALWLVSRQGDARGLAEGKVGRALTFLLLVGAAAELVVWGLRWFGLFGGPVTV